VFREGIIIGKGGGRYRISRASWRQKLKAEIAFAIGAVAAAATAAATAVSTNAADNAADSGAFSDVAGGGADNASSGGSDGGEIDSGGSLAHQAMIGALELLCLYLVLSSSLAALVLSSSLALRSTRGGIEVL
jgi:hypothetical protein